MKQADAAAREVEAARERISRLSAAILRIGGSLDVDTVLRAAVEGACELTGATFGVVTTIDTSGRPQEFVTAGLTPAQRKALASWPGGLRIFEHFRDLPGPLRISDFGQYVRSHGWSREPIPCRTFQGTTMRHRDVQVGCFYLGEKTGGGDFTEADEEMLVLFASQAAAAISNAWTHRDEHRARTDLEALVETSPVGVVVFDAGSRNLLWVNQEARRIVTALQVPGLALDELAAALTCRRGDGVEVSLDQLAGAETVRAEEMELSVPDGRSVRTLISATPSRSGSGEVLSVVVTMQDLAPLEELERLRAEFLGIVSHELRAPLAAIKGSAATVLSASRAYDPAEVQQFFRIVDQEADRMDGLIGDLLDMGRIETGTLSVHPAPAAVGDLLDQARNTFLSGGGRHAVLIDLPPSLPRVAVDERRIVQVLNNLVANASRHSPESVPIRLAASREEAFVEVSVTDGGDGVPQDELPHLFRKHAAVRAGRPGGAGLGLAICRGLVEAHGGRIRAENGGSGFGTRFAFTLPAAEESAAAAAGFVADNARPPRAGGQPATILVVDDDPQTTRYVRDALSEAGYTPLVTGDPQEVASLVGQHDPDLVLLDLMLPGTDGIELMRGLPELAERPIIFISAYGRDETIARALEAGACDYIVKPFSPTELTARARAALRSRLRPAPFMVADMVIDYGPRRVTVAGRRVPLTVTEYELLRVLSVSGERVVTYETLLRQLWKGRGGPGLVRTFVKKLRRKLGDSAGEPKYIVNVRGVGYRIAEPDQPPEPGTPGSRLEAGKPGEAGSPNP